MFISIQLLVTPQWVSVLCRDQPTGQVCPCTAGCPKDARPQLAWIEHCRLDGPCCQLWKWICCWEPLGRGIDDIHIIRPCDCPASGQLCCKGKAIVIGLSWCMFFVIVSFFPISATNSLIPTGYPTIQSWHYLPGVRIKSHTLKDSVPQEQSHFRCQPQTESPWPQFIEQLSTHSRVPVMSFSGSIID